MLAKHRANKGFLSRIYKKLSQFNIKKTKNQLENVQKAARRPRRGIHRCTQMETSVRNHRKLTKQLQLHTTYDCIRGTFVCACCAMLVKTDQTEPSQTSKDRVKWYGYFRLYLGQYYDPEIALLGNYLRKVKTYMCLWT
jgi:hypothetical protein